MIANNRTRPPGSPLIMLDTEPWEMALLSASLIALIFAQALIMVATYRVSRTLHPFVLFLSEGVTNSVSLVTGTISILGQLTHTKPLGDVTQEFIVVSICAYASNLHYLLIAVNRAFAIFAPLNYDRWWTRDNIIASLALVWAVGSGLQLINIVQYYITVGAIPLYMRIYGYVQRCVTLPSLSLYSAALCWVLLSRLLKWIKKRFASSSTPTTPKALISVDYAHVIDLRIFAYCFASFLPNCYHIFVKPPVNSLHWEIYATVRITSPALFLYVMSSAVREQMPGYELQRRFARAAINGVSRLWYGRPAATTKSVGTSPVSLLARGSKGSPSKLSPSHQRLSLPQQQTKIQV